MFGVCNRSNEARRTSFYCDYHDESYEITEMSSNRSKDYAGTGYDASNLSLKQSRIFFFIPVPPARHFSPTVVPWTSPGYAPGESERETRRS
jgi:hypothetical protein